MQEKCPIDPTVKYYRIVSLTFKLTSNTILNVSYFVQLTSKRLHRTICKQHFSGLH